MARIHIRRRHHLGIAGAREEVERIAGALAQDLHARYQWEGDELRFKRKGAAGSIALDEEAIDLRIELGLLLAPLRGTIEASIRHRLDEALGPEPNEATS